MTEAEIEIVIHRILEMFPGVRPRIISDNGTRFIGTDLQQFRRFVGMKHVRTALYYAQSNGQIELVAQNDKK